MTLLKKDEQRSRYATSPLTGLVRRLGLGPGSGRHRRRNLTELAGMQDWQLDDIGRPRQWLDRELAAAGLHQPRPDTWIRRNG